jgi:choline dehydrogenase-like flavoprotein
VRAEQAPNPDSRVQLSNEVDALGMLKVNLDWRLSSQDKETVAGVCKQLDVEFQRLGKGRIKPSQWLADPAPEWPVDPTVSKHPIGGYHHMGTTRMSDSPSQGVVDANCRIHDYANLYIAGSSVFPTGGWANPTLTILALTNRLAEHLNEKLASVNEHH